MERLIRRRPVPRRTPDIDPKWFPAGGRPPQESDELPCFIGIDASLTSTGIVALNTRSYWWRVHKPDLGGIDRLAAHRWLLEDFFDHVPEPTMIALEAYGFGARHRGMEIGELGGVVRMFLYDRGWDDRTAVIAPNTLKKFTTNNGQSKKNKMMLAIWKNWGVEVPNDDVGDAYALAQAAMTISTGEARYAWQRDAVSRSGPQRGE